MAATREHSVESPQKASHAKLPRKNKKNKKAKKKRRKPV